jgi:hypothetical protein
MRKKAPVLRAIPSPTRRAGQASPSLLRQAPASPRGSAKRPVRRYDAHSAQSRPQSGAEPGSRGADLSTPLIPLTLRAMFRTRHPRRRSSGLPAALLLSVLAVLALACAPAQAREASELQYEPEVPTVPQEERPGGTHHGSNKGGSNGGNEDAEAEKGNVPGYGGSGGDNGSQGGGSHNGQGNQAPTGNGGQPEAGSVGSGVALGEGNKPTELGEKTSSVSDDGSSPLVPILIAIVVLAAISIGAYYYRQRRQGAGSSVSPKAS